MQHRPYVSTWCGEHAQLHAGVGTATRVQAAQLPHLKTAPSAKVHSARACSSAARVLPAAAAASLATACRRSAAWRASCRALPAALRALSAAARASFCKRRILACPAPQQEGGSCLALPLLRAPPPPPQLALPSPGAPALAAPRMRRRDHGYAAAAEPAAAAAAAAGQQAGGSKPVGDRWLCWIAVQVARRSRSRACTPRAAAGRYCRRR